MNTDFLTRNAIGRIDRHLWFGRGTYRVAVPLVDLMEVGELPSLRPVPMLIPSLVGFVQVREQIIPVFDPLRLAGLLDQPLPERPFAAVTGRNHRLEMALLVDHVGRMLDLPEVHQPVQEAAVPAAFSGRFLMKGEPDLLVFNTTGLLSELTLRHTGIAPLAQITNANNHSPEIQVLAT